MDTFTLFGTRPFNHYAYQRLTNIAENINTMSDVEVLMYKDDFNDLIKKLVKSYSLKPIDISFEDKLVDLIDKPDKNGSNYFAEYTLMINGDPILLTLDPYNNGSARFPISVITKTNVITFEINLNHGSDRLTPEVIERVKESYDQLKEYISNTLLYLNNESQKFNLRLEEFIAPIVAERIEKADSRALIKQKLNFK